MRTTIDIRDELFRRAKKRAADDGVSLREVVETALRAHLSRGPRRSNYRLRWRAERGRLMPGVDLDDRAVLFDLTDGRA